MVLGTMVIAGVATAGTLGAGIKAYREEKRKKEFSCDQRECKATVAADRLGLMWHASSRACLPASRFNREAVTQKKRVPFKARAAAKNVRSFVGELIAPYVSPTRREQLAEMTAKKEDLDTSEAEKEALRAFVLASCGTFLAVGESLFYGPLYAPSLLIIGYLFKDTFKDSYQALIKERRIGIEMIVVIELLGALLGGFFVTLTVGFCFLRFMKLLLTKTEDNSRKSLVDLFGQQPRFVWFLVDSADGKGQQEIENPFEDLKSGDMVVVQAGQTIVVDGIIARGVAQIDERALTGESQPREKSVGERVFASSPPPPPPLMVPTNSRA